MTESEQLSLEELPAPASHAQDSSDIERRVMHTEPTDSSQVESNKTKISVLIGSGILQLPIWGTLLKIWINHPYLLVQALL